MWNQSSINWPQAVIYVFNFSHQKLHNPLAYDTRPALFLIPLNFFFFQNCSAFDVLPLEVKHNQIRGYSSLTEKTRSKNLYFFFHNKLSYNVTKETQKRLISLARLTLNDIYPNFDNRPMLFR